MEYLSQILARNVRLIPERAFIVTEKETLSYADFSARTAELAHILSARGIGKGDRVALYLPSTPLMAIGFWACQRLGAIAAPISATVAGTFTYAMGHAWLRVCERLARGELGAVGGALDGESVRRVFLEEFKTQAARRRMGS